MTSTLTEKAVAGRRVEFTYHRDRGLPNPPAHPGVITGTEPGYDCTLAKVRLDGTRCNLHIPVDSDGITYLDQVGEVPELPMGRFIPAASDTNGLYEKAGVLFAAVGEDGEDWIFVTDDRDKAYTAARAYAQEVGVEVDWIHAKGLMPCWAVFEWEPEDAECPWTVDWDASEGDDQALHIYYLPA